MMTPEHSKPPRVLISYAHENDGGAHADRVYRLSERLRGEGVDASIDQYEPHPPEGWPRWMEAQIRRADFVLMVCTETYYRRVANQEQPGVGLGVVWEANLIYNALYRAGAVDVRFIPVLFQAEDVKFIPDPIQGHTYYLLPGDYDRLYLRLTHQEGNRKGPLGTIRSVPPPADPPPAAGPEPAKPPDEPAEATPAAPSASAAFLSFYTRSVAEAVHVTHYLGDYGPKDLETTFALLLKTVRSVAAAFYGDKSGLEINANVMSVVPVRSRRRADYPGLAFTGARWRPDAYSHVLILRQWAEQSNRVPQHLALPVHRSAPAALFGAPRAFLSGEAQVVGDVRNAEELTRLLVNQPEAVAGDVRAYFAAASFRSFASWPCVYQSAPVGVLNIQSSAPNIFGDSDRHRDEISGYLRPFCFLLGAAIAALNAA
ncbi:MAG: toll/interleukin-1 receptor domain-containing protein [Armatimonadetes bacterium]|nr:toll/interleukin-1 receptor domain-containing protein [Armatimonadota bacterium]